MAKALGHNWWKAKETVHLGSGIVDAQGSGLLGEI